jgi:hypothetical protein
MAPVGPPTPGFVVPDTGIPDAPFPLGVRENDAAVVPGARKNSFRIWYDAIIDLLLLDPTLRQYEIAKKLNRAPVTISLVMNSDLFKARYEQRKAAHNAAIHSKLNGQMVQVADLGLQLILETMKSKRDKIPLETLVDTTTDTLDRLGFGVPKGQRDPVPGIGVQVNNTMVVAPVSREVLESARAQLREIEGKIVTGEIAPLDDTPGSENGNLSGAEESFPALTPKEEESILHELGSVPDRTPEPLSPKAGLETGGRTLDPSDPLSKL